MATTNEYGLGEHAFPRGWFMIAAADELGPGAALPVRFFGRDRVLYRGESGKAYLVEAYCPHMGAHLARNMTSFVLKDREHIQGDAIRCPYHGWRFGPDGRCNDIPYSPQKIPAAAKLESWPVIERAGCIWMWHDPEEGEPDYDLPPFEEYGKPGWVNWKIDHLGELATHPVEILDNMADRAHFEPVHGSSDVELFENEFDGHVLIQKITAGHRSMQGATPLENYTWYTGPGILQSRLSGVYPGIILITHTPIDDGIVKVWHGLLVSVANAEPTEEDVQNARSFQEISRIAFAQDFEIWANKQPCINPMVVLGDGPIGKLRTWYRQFYNPRARAGEFHARVNGLHVTRGTRSAPFEQKVA